MSPGYLHRQMEAGVGCGKAVFDSQIFGVQPSGAFGGPPSVAAPEFHSPVHHEGGRMVKLSRVPSGRDTAIGGQVTYKSIQNPQKSHRCFLAFTRRQAQFPVEVDKIAVVYEYIWEF